MRTRKTQYAWMALGGLICLFGLVLACKLRDGNKALAQTDKAPPLPPLVDVPSKPPSTPVPMEKKLDAPKPPAPPWITPEKALSAPPKSPASPGPKKPLNAPSAPLIGFNPSSLKSPSLSPPKATLDMPLPAPTGKPSPGPVLPASFGPNTPTPMDKTESRPALPPLGSTPPPRPTAPPAAEKSSKPAAPSSLGSLRTMIKATEGGEPKVAPTAYAPPVAAAHGSGSAPAADHEARPQPGEPPLAPAPGPVQIYHARGAETLQDIARRTLGNSERWTDVHKLNPALKTEGPVGAGTTVRLPADACVQADDAERVKPLPALRPRPTPPRPRVLPLTGTYLCSLDDKGQLTLPRALRDQLGAGETVLLSPGPDRCLWLTDQPHLERLGERLEQSQAHEADVRVFKRLYFAQTEKLTINGEGRVAVPERLGQFAGLHQEVVLVGIDDHFEVWDAARWRQYTQQKSAGQE